MTRTLSPGQRIAVIAAAVILLVLAIALTRTIPPVQGLGDKVRLPMFHGGSTWVNLITFTLAGLLALGYLLLKRPELYRWAAGFRFVSAPLWVVNTVLGVIAAARTWDFSGSQASPLTVIRDDPRLMAQFQLLIILIVVLAASAMVESRGMRAFFDVVFAGAMWGLLGSVFVNPEARALHPDSPVLNSGSEIQVPFFAIVGCVFLFAALVALLVRDRIARSE